LYGPRAGKGIPKKYRGGGPAAVGGMKAALAGDVAKIGYEIYKDELAQCAACGPAAQRMPTSFGETFSLGSRVTDQLDTRWTHRSNEFNGVQ